MLRKWSMAALLAAGALLFGAIGCSNGDGDGNDEKDLSQTTETFAVKYDVAGLAEVTMKDGSKGSSIQKQQNETVTADELWNVTGIKDGYKFAGWYMDADCTEPFADFAVTKHTTLYAKFTATNGVAAIKVIRYETEKSYMDAKRTIADTLPPSYLSCPPTSVADGLYFSGWFADKGCTERAEPGDAIGESGMTLYAEWSDLRPGAGATFAGTDLDDIDGLYARSTGKDEKTGEYTYESLSKPEKNKDYYPITGVSKIGGALVFSKTMGNVRLRSDSTNGSTVAELRLDNSLNSSNVTLVESLANYVCVRPTGAGTVTATLSNVPSSSVTGTSVAKALFIDGNGKVIAQVAIDNKKDTKTAPVTLSCTVSSADPVYLAFGRYGDAGGQLGVRKITFTTDASGSGGDVPVVANLPDSVGTNPFAAGTYTPSTGVSGGWWICFGEGKIQEVGGTKIEIDTAKYSITLLSRGMNGHENTSAVLKYAYDSTKKEIYLALSRLGWEKLDDDDSSYLWTKDELVSYLQSMWGRHFPTKDTRKRTLRRTLRTIRQNSMRVLTWWSPTATSSPRTAA
ncbi:MAG: InlB B-repeat-containing protein [Treponema sp.]|nr:InlB B-repeat-containing protein [Treponema sp.]